MTRKQAIVLLIVGLAAAVGLVVAHLALPIDASWGTNRLLHYVWMGATAASAVGALVWVLWPRPKPRRRDAYREQARRRTFALLGTIVLAVGLVVFGEMHREASSEDRLDGDAFADLRAIGGALGKYEANHHGAAPAALADLVPEYLALEHLYYAYRAGPVEAPPPAAGADAAAEKPSYALVQARPTRGSETPARRDPVVAYLRPGLAWAPLTAILEKGGSVRVTGEDRVTGYEKPPK